MRRSHPLLALVAIALVVAAGTTLDRRAPREGSGLPAGSAPSGAWLCPHGGGSDWTVTLSVANPSSATASIRVTTISSSRSLAPKSLSVEPGSTLQVPVPATDRASSSLIEWFGPWVAAGWVSHAGGDESGVAAEPCVAAAGTTWFAADGDTGEGQASYLVVMNPFDARANVSIALFASDRPPIRFEKLTGVEIPPMRATAFQLNVAKGESALGAEVDVASGRVAVATLDVNTNGGVRSVVGSTATTGRVFLPATGDNGTSTLVVFEPGSAPARFGATLRGRGTPAVAGELTGQSQPPQSADIYPVTTKDPSSIDVVGESGGPPFATVRRVQGPSEDADATAGAVASANTWVVLPTAAGEPATPGLVIENPSDAEASVTLHVLPVAGENAPTDVTVRVRAGRVTAAPVDFLAAAPLSAVLVTSDAPVVATGASSSLGVNGVAGYAVAVGLPVPPST